LTIINIAASVLPAVDILPYGASDCMEHLTV
jgi:hypothetical protein